MSFQINLKCDICNKKFPIVLLFPTIKAYIEEAKKRDWIVFHDRNSSWIIICDTCARNYMIVDDKEEETKRQVNEIFKETQDEH